MTRRRGALRRLRDAKFHLAPSLQLVFRMTPLYILLWGSWALFGLTAIWALAWALDDGQFRDPETAAASIFDTDELEAQDG